MPVRSWERAISTRVTGVVRAIVAKLVVRAEAIWL